MKYFLFLLSISFTCNLFGAAVSVCLDPLATNYDPTQDPTVNPGIQFLFDNGSLVIDSSSCEYPVDLGAASPLFFSEYGEGSSNNKYLEIFNPTADTIDLAGYAYPSVANDPTTLGEHEYWNAFDEGASIAPGDVYVIAHGSADATILAEADETHNFLSNGDDGYALAFGTEDSYVVLDWLGNFDADPGSGWAVAGVVDATKDHALVRKFSVTSGNTDWISSAGTSSEDSEWIVLDINDWTFLGSHTDLPFGCISEWADNYDEFASDDDGSCYKFGCTDSLAFNFNEFATDDDGSCYKYGCISEWADNYDEFATYDDGSCELIACNYPYFFEYNSNYTISDPLLCITLIVEGCTNSDAENYNEDANLDDGSCVIFGCINQEAENYNPDATIQDNSCVYYGCTNETAENYNEQATDNDGSCIIYGCVLSVFPNYNPEATIDDNSCSFDFFGGNCELPIAFEGNTGSNMTVMLTTAVVTSLNATDENAYLVALNQDGLVVGSKSLFDLTQTSLAVWGDDTQTPEVDGASANEIISFQLVNGTDLYDVEMPLSVTYVGNNVSVQIAAAQLTLVVCESSTILGCTDVAADNYNMDATEDDGSCTYTVLGCTDASAFNYNMDATEDDGSCIAVIEGCTDVTALNYNEFANTDDGSCERLGCMAEWADNFDNLATQEDGSCYKYGCMADWADNFDPFATLSSLELPEPFEGNTGSNMTIMLLPNLISSLGVVGENAYLVALNQNGLVVGSEAVYGVAQTSLAAWGDDTQTPEVDGAQSNELLAFQLVDGTSVYDVEMATSVTYVSSGLSPQATAATLTLASGDDDECYRFGCMADWADNFDPFATLSSLELPEPFEGHTGSNMTIMLLPNLISSLGVVGENAYLVALNQNGLVVGSEAVYGITQTSLAAWGDDTQTPEVDGALYNELLAFQLVDGTSVYDVEMATPVTYVSNGLSHQATAATLTLASGDECYRFGCTSEWADNFDELATDDDGSCERLGCMAEWADNFDNLATQEDGSCNKYGCTADWADNFDPQATQEDGSCYKYGCMADWADNFDPFATISASDLPEPFIGNTGSNMTVMLTTAIVTSLNATDENAYLVALNQDGLVVGSQSVFGLTQTTIGVWGNDTQTTEVDGALSNEIISFQLVNGTDLYNVEMPTAVSFAANGLSLQNGAATLTLVTGDECYRFGCTSEWADNFDELATDDDGSCERLGCMAEWADNYDDLATEDDGSCYRSGCMSEWADNFDPLATLDDGSCYKYGCTADWADNFDPFATLSSLELPEHFEGNTGSNMTVMLTTAIVTSFNATDENAYLVALNQNGLVVGSTSLFGITQTSMAVWGDDTNTLETDGAAANEIISFQLVNGTDLYDVVMLSAVSFVANGLSVQTTAATLTLASGDDDECYRFGCTAEWADNFDELATDDDGSCERLGCMAEWADNYDDLATEDDGSCDRLGCMDVLDCNYDVFATTQDNSCIGYPGCTEEFYVEYNPLAGCHAEYLCQTSWLEAFDSLEIVSNQLEDENSTYLDSIGLLNLNYQDLVQESTEDVEVLTTSLDSVEAVVGSLNGELETLENLNVDILAENSSYLDSIQDLAYDVLVLENEILENTIQTTFTLDSLEESLEQISIELVECNSPIQIDLQTGWNMIGYTFKEPQDVVASMSEIYEIIDIVKDNQAEVYWPEFGFNGIGDLIPGQGYQVKVEEAYEGFYFADVDGQRFDLVPTVPQWAINMQVESHPNDIRTLVRVVNMLGQEVNPESEPKGTVLLYLYNDATVEKKLTK